MSRRMIDPQSIIKSQVADDKFEVNLNEILEKYGTQHNEYKSVTLQLYPKMIEEDTGTVIFAGNVQKGNVIANTAITITKEMDLGYVNIMGFLVDNLGTMNFISLIHIPAEEYENGIILRDSYEFDVHVIKV